LRYIEGGVSFMDQVPEIAAAMIRETLKTLISEPGQKLCTFVADYTGIGPKVIENRARAAAKAKAIETDAQAKAIIDLATADKQEAIARAEGEAEVGLVLERGKIERRSLTARAKAREHLTSLREQRSLETIVTKAVPFLPNEVGQEMPDPDWAYRFFDTCKGISNEDMQTVWAKVLAREVVSPNSFSLLTLDVLRTLTKKEANLFTALCSQIATIETRFRDTAGLTVPLTEINYYEPHQEHRAVLNVGTDEMNLLASHGLLTQAGSRNLFEMVGLPGSTNLDGNAYLKYFGSTYHICVNGAVRSELRRKGDDTVPGVTLYVTYATLSAVGQELLPISGAKREQALEDLLIGFFAGIPHFVIHQIPDHL
jgi:hypothetical protein